MTDIEFANLLFALVIRGREGGLTYAQMVGEFDLLAGTFEAFRDELTARGILEGK